MRFYAFLPTAALAFVGHKVSLPRAAPRQAADISSLDISSLDPAVLGGVVAAVGAAAVLASARPRGTRRNSSELVGTPAASRWCPRAGKGGDGPAGGAPAATKATAAKVTNAVWSGDAFRAATWPAGPARSFSSSPPAAVQGPSAEELAAAAAASTAAKAKLASLGIARSAPPAMPREAWSGSPYSSPGRAAAASSTALGTAPSWLS
jgi:hypothetical protein